MQQWKGNLRKMQAKHADPVDYTLVLGEESIALNALRKSCLVFEFTGKIHCVQCGRKTNKSFQQGHCYPCMRRLHECNLCILHPEKCLVEHGNCPTDDWAHSQCHQHHIVYLANSSGLKVGITRETQVPTRWIDQGAWQALPIFKVKNRYQSGLVEVLLKDYLNDKTNWRAMLRGYPEPIDLVDTRDKLFSRIESELEGLENQLNGPLERLLAANPVTIEYPVDVYPTKISSLSLDKTPCVEGKLLGIKGQYLIFEEGVFNIRKFSGYEVIVTVKQ